jgi:hypothetical protein
MDFLIQAEKPVIVIKMKKEESFFLNALKMADITERIVNRFAQKNSKTKKHSNLKPKNIWQYPTSPWCGRKSKKLFPILQFHRGIKRKNNICAFKIRIADSNFQGLKKVCVLEIIRICY